MVLDCIHFSWCKPTKNGMLLPWQNYWRYLKASKLQYLMYAASRPLCKIKKKLCGNVQNESRRLFFLLTIFIHHRWTKYCALDRCCSSCSSVCRIFDDIRLSESQIITLLKTRIDRPLNGSSRIGRF